MTFEEKLKRPRKTREYKRWEKGWKRHMPSRSVIRRVGSRVRAAELGIVKN